jgi:hypothetical protein
MMMPLSLFATSGYVVIVKLGMVSIGKNRKCQRVMARSRELKPEGYGS